MIIFFVAPADPVREGAGTGEVSGAAASARDSRHSTGVIGAWKHERSGTGEVSGAAASARDSGHSTGVKRKRFGRGTYNNSST